MPQTAITTCVRAGLTVQSGFLTSAFISRYNRCKVVFTWSRITIPVIRTRVSVEAVLAARAIRDIFSCVVKLPKPDRVAHGLVSSLFQCPSTKRVVETEFLWSGSPQGLSSLMLVVIFLSRHCSLLCSPSFLIILSAIYQTMKSERKKKMNLSFLCIMAYVKFFEEKCFVFSLFPCRRKELVVCRNDPNSSLFFCLFLYVSLNSQKKRGFQ